MERVEILRKSAELFDQNCKGCKKWKETGGQQKHHKAAQEYCEKQCEIGKQLLELGDYLTFGRPSKVARDLTKEVYMEEREKGLLDRDIQKKYKISNKVLWKRKVFWKLTTDINKSKKHLISKETYLAMKEEGLPDFYICEKKLGIHINTLMSYKREWGIKHTNDLNAITEGPNGEEISFEMYIFHKSNGWTDERILAHWGIGRTTMQRKKKAWRICGYDVDKFNSHKVPSTVKRG